MKKESSTTKEADHPEEILDLVNENDVVIGTASRKEIYAEGLRNYRVVHGFIRRTDGKIWTPRRVPTKKLYPNALDFSIAGHVESGESYDEAFQKEAWEEVGIDLTKTLYTKLISLNPHEHAVHCFQVVYEIQSDLVPDYNQEDFSGYEWLYPGEIVEKYESGEDMKSDIAETLKLCYKF